MRNTKIFLLVAIVAALFSHTSLYAQDIAGDWQATLIVVLGIDSVKLRQNMKSRRTARQAAK